MYNREILNNCGSLFAHMKDLRLRGAWNIELMDVSLNLFKPSRDYVACKHILNWWPVVVISSGLLLQAEPVFSVLPIDCDAFETD